tara:strand:- start:4226 stop:4564 length:339 start_codon:yes stop_codon:yes gene_type:complete
MYDYTITLTYRGTEDDGVYRKELLQCFNIDTIDDIDPHILSIYNEYGEKYDTIIEKLKNNTCYGFSDMPYRSLFILLFAWEYFYENHKLLQALHYNKDIDNALKNLLNKISI